MYRVAVSCIELQCHVSSCSAVSSCSVIYRAVVSCIELQCCVELQCHVSSCSVMYRAAVSCIELQCHVSSCSVIYRAAVLRIMLILCSDLQVRNPPGCGSDFSGDVEQDEQVLFGRDEQDEASSPVFPCCIYISLLQHFVVSSVLLVFPCCTYISLLQQGKKPDLDDLLGERNATSISRTVEERRQSGGPALLRVLRPRSVCCLQRSVDPSSLS